MDDNDSDYESEAETMESDSYDSDPEGEYRERGRKRKHSGDKEPRRSARGKRARTQETPSESSTSLSVPGSRSPTDYSSSLTPDEDETSADDAKSPKDLPSSISLKAQLPDKTIFAFLLQSKADVVRAAPFAHVWPFFIVEDKVGMKPIGFTADHIDESYVDDRWGTGIKVGQIFKHSAICQVSALSLEIPHK